MVVGVGEAAKVIGIGLGKNWFGRVHVNASNTNKGKDLGNGHYSNRVYTAGVFGRDLESSQRGGSALLLPPKACFAPDSTYNDARMYQSLIEAQQGNADIVTVTSANWLHRPGFEAALAMNPKAVICEKPFGLNGNEGREMHEAAEASGIPALIAFTYTYYPMVQLAERIVQDKEIFGEVIGYKGEYPQGWLAGIESDDADWNWRTLPDKAGESCVGGDIFSHNLALERKVTGLNIGELFAVGATTAIGRKSQIQDTLKVVGRLENGAPFSMEAQQTARGSDNDVWFEVTGSKRSVKWSHTEPHILWVTDDNNWVKLKAGFDAAGIPKEILDLSTYPTGHPGGFSGDALGNMYETAERIARGLPHMPYQGTDYGLAANLVVDAAVQSSKLKRMITLNNLPRVVRNGTMRVGEYWTPFNPPIDSGL